MSSDDDDHLLNEDTVIIQNNGRFLGVVYFTDRTMTYGPDWNFTDCDRM